MHRWLFRSVVFLFKFAFVFVAIVSPVTAVWDSIDPWPISDETRQSFEADYFYVPVGGSWYNGERLGQSALLVPKSFSAPRFIYVGRIDGTISTHEDTMGIFILVFTLCVGWYLIFRYVRHFLARRSET